MLMNITWLRYSAALHCKYNPFSSRLFRTFMCVFGEVFVCISSISGVWTRKGCKSEGKGEKPIKSCWPSVPERSCSSSVAQRQLRWASWHRSTRTRSHGVSGGQSSRACWQRCSRQQEDSHHSTSPSAGHLQRRGTEQVAVNCQASRSLRVVFCLTSRLFC